MRIHLLILLLVVSGFTGCGEQSQPSAEQIEYQRWYIKESKRQSEEYDRQMQIAAEQADRAAAQLDRSAALLDRQEKQADRFDAILSAWESQVEKDAR